MTPLPTWRLQALSATDRPDGPGSARLAGLAVCLSVSLSGVVVAAIERPPTAVTTSLPAEEEGPALGAERFYIRQYRVTGAKHLPRINVEEAVYPFLGPGRDDGDIEGARAALQQAYHDKGFERVTVQMSVHNQRRGIVVLEVTEATVGRLRVKGSRYFSIETIKRRIPSLAEGTVPNSNDVTRDLIALNPLNRWPDRQVKLKRVNPGAVPNTVDIDLEVKDKLPLHGSLELNNRYSPDTTQLRVNGSLSYGNLWQAGHTAGVSFQVAPERTEDALVYSGYYSVPVPGTERVSFMVLGTKQDSDISTLGGSAVAGRGYIIGARTNIVLPEPFGSKGFFHSVSLGMDYKNFEEDIVIGLDAISAPIEYYPISANYGATWLRKLGTTELNAGVSFSLRGLGSDEREFDSKRYLADGNYIYFRGDVANTQELPGGVQIYVKAQGQAASQPLVNSEQYSGGGLGTVRGYLESEALGDNGLFGTLEVRSPSLVGRKQKPPQTGSEADADANEDAVDAANEWRFHVFVDGGVLTLNDALPGQEDQFDLASVGAGTRFRLWNHLNGSLDAGLALVDQGRTSAGDWLLTFRLWADF